MQYGHHTVLEYCGIDHVGVSAERASYRVNAVSPVTNSRDAAHGGLLMTLLEVTPGQAVLAAVTDAKSFATVQIYTDFIRPGHGQLTATARTMRAGRSVAFAKGEIRGEKAH